MSTAGLTRAALRATMGVLAEPVPFAALTSSAIVFAPHQDDETLGCGGTIALKRRAGAEVTVVFMTDGSRSHHHLISPECLREIRATEARKACAALGVTDRNVHFLGYGDSRLTTSRMDAILRVRRLLDARRPAEVYVPYRYDTPADHRATRDIVLRALAAGCSKAVVHEYPVWFWHHWPWVPSEGSGWRGTSRTAVAAIASLTRCLRQLRAVVDISSVREVKRTALACHRSQMTRPLDDPRWLTLGDVAGGAFLQCFDDEHERFMRYEFAGHPRRASNA